MQRCGADDKKVKQKKYFRTSQVYTMASHTHTCTSTASPARSVELNLTIADSPVTAQPETVGPV
jgi:hypothetical protein